MRINKAAEFARIFALKVAYLRQIRQFALFLYLKAIFRSRLIADN